jgi:hypothetical protein
MSNSAGDGGENGVASKDEQRAIRCHEFLGQLTRSSIG